MRLVNPGGCIDRLQLKSACGAVVRSTEASKRLRQRTSVAPADAPNAPEAGQAAGATDIEQLLSQICSLTADEQRRFRQILDQELPDAPIPAQPTEDDFKRRLLELGLLKDVKPPVRDLGPYQHREPFKIQGKPLSETIIEERR